MDELLNLSAHLFFRLHSARFKHAIEEFLVESSRHETADFFHLESEVTVVLCSLFLAHLEESSEFVLAVCHRGIESDDITHLSAFKNLLLVVVYEVSRHQASLVECETAFEHVTLLVLLRECTAEDVAVSIFFYVFRVTSLLSKVLHLSVDLLFAHLDVIVRELVCA